MKHLLITLEVRDGEREHTHRCLHTTRGNNIQFAAERYASTYWGEGTREDDYWWFFGEIIVKLERVTELTEYEFKLMDNLFNGITNKAFDDFVENADMPQ